MADSTYVRTTESTFVGLCHFLDCTCSDNSLSRFIECQLLCQMVKCLRATMRTEVVRILRAQTRAVSWIFLYELKNPSLTGLVLVNLELLEKVPEYTELWLEARF